MNLPQGTGSNQSLFDNILVIVLYHVASPRGPVIVMYHVTGTQGPVVVLYHGPSHF